MKRMKMGIVALVIAVLAISAVAVAAQTPSGTATPPAQGQTQGQPPAQGQGRPGRGQGMGMGGEFQVIADALGVDLATLRTDLQSGKTIADIAKEKNIELSTIVDAVVAKTQDNLKTAVTDGHLTQEQADAQIALLKADLNARFSQKMDANGRGGFGFGGRGDGGFGGPMGPNGNAPIAPDATPEATAAANA